MKIGAATIITLADAKREARRVVAAATIGGDPQEERETLRAIPTLAAFLRGQYLPHVKSYKRSWRTDEIVVRTWLIPALGHLRMDELTEPAITSMLNARSKRNYAGSTINRVRAVLIHACNLAIKWKVPGASFNPARDTPRLPERVAERYLTDEETERLILSIEADVNASSARAVMILLLTGARRSEVTQARWSHINWEQSELLVPLSKSGKPRAIRLPKAAMSILTTVYAEATDRGPNDFVWASSYVRCDAPFWREWDRIRRRAGLQDVRMHDLRHSFASRLVNKGVSLYVVQRLLGHSTPTMTQRYSHLSSTTLQDAAELASGALPELPSANKRQT